MLIYTPYPGYEKEIVPSGGGQGSQQLIWRTTYTFNGQPIATRVTDNVTPANSGLYFLHNDHLGSASVMSSSAGAPVADTTARYLPFGDWRTEPTADLTDRGYTSHKHNNMGSDDIGLIYMNARYYVPGIARFASADTIVPNPSNPQSYNRYSYVENNPINRHDPSGHCGVEQTTITAQLSNPVLGTTENFTYTASDPDKLSTCLALRDELETRYGINITGEWTLWEMGRLEIALQAVIDAFVRVGLTNTESLEAFKDLFEDLTIKRIRRFHNKARAQTTSKNRINIYHGAFFQRVNDADTGWGLQSRSITQFTITVTHELGHIWDRRVGYSLANGIRDATQASGDICVGPLCFGDYQLGRNAPDTGYTIDNSREDWATSFSAFVVDQSLLLSERQNNTTRIDFVRDQILNLR